MRPIDADELSDRILYLLQSGVPSQDIRRGIKKVYTMLCDAPTIEAEPVKHGRWERRMTKIYACSECTNEVTDRQRQNYSFCPNCGAKMDGDET